MKHLLALVILLMVCSSLQARTFEYGFLVHQVKDQVRVEVYSGISGLSRSNLTMAEAIAYVRSAPHSMGVNRIAILTSDFSAADCADLLKAVLDDSGHSQLAYFGTKHDDLLKKFIEEQWEKDPANQSASAR